MGCPTIPRRSAAPICVFYEKLTMSLGILTCCPYPAVITLLNLGPKSLFIEYKHYAFSLRYPPRRSSLMNALSYRLCGSSQPGFWYVLRFLKSGY